MKNAVLNRKKEIAQLKNAVVEHKNKIDVLNIHITKLEELQKVEQVELNKIGLEEISKLLIKASKIMESMGDE